MKYAIQWWRRSIWFENNGRSFLIPLTRSSWFFFLLYCTLSNERYLPEPYSFWGKYVPHQQPQGVRDKLHRCNRACERCAWKNNTENTPEENDVLMRSFYKLGIWKDTKKTKKCWATMIIWRRREMRIELAKIPSSSSIPDRFRKFYNNRYEV